MATRLTPAAKGFIAVVVLAVVGVSAYYNPQVWERIAPKEKKQGSNVPPAANLPETPGESPAAVASAPPGCVQNPEVRIQHMAWNAQMGLLYATGGKQSTADSLMCKGNVNLKLIREDNGDNMQASLVAFAEDLKKGTANPPGGTHFVIIMGDGSAAFLKGLNDKLVKLGPEYMAQVVGSFGFSRGEDKLMGPAEWKKNPQAARGGLVAGVLRDGDWNIALKWLGDNKIPNNPDEASYDPDALNWVNASDYIDAAQKYVSGFCTELKNSKSGKKEKHCVNGVVTWTPGDVTVAEKRGGLVSIVSTREYRSQMPAVLIGIRKWTQANRATVENLLSAAFTGADAIKASDDAVQKGAAIAAAVYAEKDAAYWSKYFHAVTQPDKTGVAVELGGSAVSNLADDLQTFGLVPGSTNLFAATYTVFGNIVKAEYPNLVPAIYPVDQILDTSFLKNLQAKGSTTTADMPKFEAAARVAQVVSHRSWEIQFQTGSNAFTPSASAELDKLFNDLVVAGGTLVEIHGHTDNQGSANKNQKLSEDRAFAVKRWLEQKSPANFPEGRVKVFAHGMSEPLDSNSTEAGRAKNRRVEIVLGTTS